MKRKTRLLSMLLCCVLLLGLLPVTVLAEDGDVAINDTNFPDANFRTVVSEFDTDSDGVLSVAEIASVKEISCGAKSISSLQGIEYFTALEILRCYYNQLTSLDVSKNTALVELSCYNNQLTSLDVSKNTALKNLDCSKNKLTSLDVSQNTALQYLECNSNKLTSLDVSKNEDLFLFRCSGNQLTSLDVSKNKKLDTFSCGSNQLTSIDISNNLALTHFVCDYNKLTSLDISKNTALTHFQCCDNQLTSLDMSNNKALKTIYCPTNPLGSLDVSNNTALDYLTCYDNLLTSLDTSNNLELRKLDCSNNPLKSLDVSSNTKLTNLRCNYTQLTSLDLSNNTALEKFECGGDETDIHVPESGAFDLTTLPGKFDVSKASEWTGGTVEGSILTVSANKVTYKYDAGNGYSTTFTMNVVWHSDEERFTVSFNANGGSGEMADVTVAYGSYTLPKCGFTAPKGKQFAGWATSANGAVISGTTITVTEDTTLYAIWENIPVTTYTVSFNANGGSGSMDAVTVVSGESYDLPECGFTAPKGKQFKGWAASPDGKVISDPAISVTGDITLYAVWETIPTQEVSTGEELAAAIESNALSIKLTADITVNEMITLSNKEIILDLNGHVLKNSASAWVIQLDDGESSENTALTLIDSNPTATHENLPYKGGVIDDGIVVTTTGTGDNNCRLYANGGSVTGHVNLASYASSIRCTSDTPTAFYGNAEQYGEIYGGIFYGNTSLKTIKNPTLTFRYDNGNIYAREVLEAGKKVIALENPTKTGYTFTGWDKVIPETMPEEDLIITAQWTANQYAITYEGLEGVDEGQTYPDTHTYDTETAIPNPTKAGYTFSGWKVNGGATPVKNLTLGAKDYTDDITLTAVWENILCTVSFDANGGSGEMADVTVVYGSYTLPECKFTAPDGKQFKGWATSASGKVISDTAITVTEDTTLYAVWEDILCTVSFDANGGSGEMDDETVVYGSYTLPECGFTAPEGKQFKGWAASADGEVISDTAIPVTSDITLYAVWEDILCTVSFDANGGSGEMDDETVVYGSYTLPECGFTAPEGKQFKGWAASADGEVISDTAIPVTEDTTLYAIWSEPESIPATPVKPGWISWLDKIFGDWWGDEEEKCDHVYTSVVTEPTCEEKGYTTHTCQKCGDTYKDSYTDPLGHNFENGICTRCGKEEASKPENPGRPSWDHIWDWIPRLWK